MQRGENYYDVVVVILCCSLFLVGIAAAADIFDFVNPYIGTGGNGYGTGGIPLGAQIPFGSVRLGADTCQYHEEWSPWEHTGGYYYGDHFIRMLSHTHLVGAGVVDYGAIGILPSAFIPSSISHLNEFNRFPWMEPFSHSSEITQPGYYSVLLEKSQITVELTATANVGLHRYSYLMPPPQAQPPQNHDDDNNSNRSNIIIFDTSYTLQYDACTNSSFSVNFEANEVTGYLHLSGSLSNRFGGVRYYYVIQFNDSFSHDYLGTWRGSRIREYEQSFAQQNFSMAGNDIGFWLKLRSTFIEFYVGMSYISLEQARTNLKSDLSQTVTMDVHKNKNNIDMDSVFAFDAIRNQTQSKWRQMLNKVVINTDDADSSAYITHDNLTIFYSALYHSFLAPTNFAEADGRYLGFDGQIHSVSTAHSGFYSDISGWDVFRSEFPWLALSEPALYADIMQSLVRMYTQGGDLPRWPLANGYTNCMFGTHANVMLADAVAHNLSARFDVETAYAGMYQSATQTQAHAGRAGLAQYIALGYVPYEQNSKSCCLTLAYAYDDWAVSLVAAHLGKDADAHMFYNRSLNFATQFSRAEQFMCPRFANGSFACPADKFAFGDKYTEGNAWHYRFYAPQNMPALIALFGDGDDHDGGGADADAEAEAEAAYFVQQLSVFFERSFDDPFNILPNEYYWAGNEEDLFAVWGFAYAPAHRQDLTAKYSRRLVETRYLNAADGIPGNDDYGTMSAWLLFAMLGFYPRSGDGSYVIGSPFFNDVTLQRGDNGDGDIHVRVHNAPHVYVVNCTVDGIVQPTPILDIAQLLNGADIEFWMSEVPSQTFWRRAME